MWCLYTNSISNWLRTAQPGDINSLALWPVLKVYKWFLVVREKLQLKRCRC